MDSKLTRLSLAQLAREVERHTFNGYSFGELMVAVLFKLGRETTVFKNNQWRQRKIGARHWEAIPTIFGNLDAGLRFLPKNVTFTISSYVDRQGRLLYTAKLYRPIEASTAAGHAQSTSPHYALIAAILKLKAKRT